MAYTSSTVYVTKQDYLDFAGIDLDLELKKSKYDNPGKAVEIFIRRTTDWMYDFIQTRYFNDTFDDDAFKKAIMHQIDFILKNGDTSLSAISSGTRLASNAYQVLHRAGMCNTWSPSAYYYPEESDT